MQAIEQELERLRLRLTLLERTRPSDNRKRLSNRRACSTFEVEVGGLHYVATVSRFDDGRLAEIFIGNHKSNSGADVNARHCGIVCSIALQFGADVATIRRALSRDSHNRPSGVLAAVLDIIAEGEQ